MRGGPAQHKVLGCHGAPEMVVCWLGQRASLSKLEKLETNLHSSANKLQSFQPAHSQICSPSFQFFDRAPQTSWLGLRQRETKGDDADSRWLGEQNQAGNTRVSGGFQMHKADFGLAASGCQGHVADLGEAAKNPRQDKLPTSQKCCVASDWCG